MQEKTHDQHADDDQFLDEVFAGGGNGLADEIAAIIGAHDLDAWRHGRFEFLELGLEALDDLGCVLAEAHDHDPTDHFSLAVQFDQATPHVRAEPHRRDVAD